MVADRVIGDPSARIICEACGAGAERRGGGAEAWALRRWRWRDFFVSTSFFLRVTRRERGIGRLRTRFLELWRCMQASISRRSIFKFQHVFLFKSRSNNIWPRDNSPKFILLHKPRVNMKVVGFWILRNFCSDQNLSFNIKILGNLSQTSLFKFTQNKVRDVIWIV
jgi:hypothetical protein